MTAGPSDNFKLMPLGTWQKDLNSSTDIEATRLLTVGDSRLDPPYAQPDWWKSTLDLSSFYTQTKKGDQLEDLFAK